MAAQPPRPPAACAFDDACLHDDRQVHPDQRHLAGGGAVGHEDCFEAAMDRIGPTLQRVTEELLPAIEAQSAAIDAWAAQPLIRAVLRLTDPEGA